MQQVMSARLNMVNIFIIPSFVSRQAGLEFTNRHIYDINQVQAFESS